MSEPAKNPGQQPEGYQPKDAPERLKALAEAQGQNRSATIEDLQAYIASGGEPPRSKKIRNLRRLWHDYASENFYLEGCLAAVLKAVGERAVKVKDRPDFDYMFLLTLSGTLFTQIYHYGSDGKTTLKGPAPDPILPGLSSVLNHDILPHMFRQLGYAYLYIDRDMLAEQPALAMNAVKAAIAKGIPVMTCGIGNVQMDRFVERFPEWSTIGGYDKDGNLLVNVFAREAAADKQGYCTVKNGLAGSGGLYILGEKQHTMDVPDLYRQAIHAIPPLITMPARYGTSFGKQAFYDWADGLLDDGNIENLSDDPYAGFLWHGHHGPWIVALTNECYMRVYFDKVIEACGLPEAAAVKGVYTKIYANLPELQKLHGGDFFATNEVIAKREVREELAAILRHMGDLHNELLELFV